ncbi:MULTISPECIES: M20 aminoacylase family protein [unclassified Aureimonas]|uniref:M20 aminoacylase family protein n=1 Tax=unclassified Aureimonas TaxID=2615206 RepID=UPI0006F317CC|nr:MULTISPECIES: M20 aminoacylase family protein [unclassified Aureimonas]KQT64380.1 amidohydrolase [Aureimonas sp. Leaf427]KQT81571.1 amidohydrolase [Aureimonas sp. Leaf460]
MSRHRTGASRIRQTIGGFVADFVELRQDLHRHPELAFQEQRTSDTIAALLDSWGYAVTRGIGGTGLVATLKRGNGPKRLGIRADMDALPIEEETGLPHASLTAGAMHACGHDGHTAILLAAARYLAEDGRFSGTLNLVFQPAEEIGQGARQMIGDGLFERFPCDAVFGLHNWPGVPAGRFGFVAGPAMASVDWARIRIRGRGGHGAEPHQAVDPVVAAAHVVTGLQTIVSRNAAPLDLAVVTIGSIHGGGAANVIPDTVDLTLTTRAFRPEIRTLLERRIKTIATLQAESFGAIAEIEWKDGFPSVVNHAVETEIARAAAVRALGAAAVEADFAPRTASEDFAFMLEARPGSYLFVGNGDSAPLHSPRYDFNDALIEPAATYWATLAETFLTSPEETHG